MTAEEYLGALRRHVVAIVVLGLLGAAVAFGYAQYVPKQYQSRATVMIVASRGDNSAELVQGSNYVENLVQTYAILTTSSRVLNPVIDELALATTPGRLASVVTVETPLNTVVLQITVQDTVPERAQQIATAVAAQLSEAVADVSPVGSNGRPAVRVETIATPRLPSAPFAPNIRRVTGLGLVGGLGVGVVYALLRRRLGGRISGQDDIQAVTEVPLLGEVSSLDAADGGVNALLQRPHARFSETLRQTAASLKFVEVAQKRRCVMITSASAGEGKSTFSLGLALTLAQFGHSVLYIEADLRRGSAAFYTQLEEGPGLTNVVGGEVLLDKAVRTWGDPRLFVLLGGDTVPNPGLVLSSRRMQQMLQTAKKQYDYVILDTAPVLPVSDALWLSPWVDETIVVVRYNSTTRASLGRTMESLRRTKSPVVGLVLNAKPTETRSAYYYAARSDASDDGTSQVVRTLRRLTPSLRR